MVALEGGEAKAISEVLMMPNLPSGFAMDSRSSKRFMQWTSSSTGQTVSPAPRGIALTQITSYAGIQDAHPRAALSQ
jgi:hypothetical protein